MHGITRFFCALLIVAASAFSQQWPQGPSFYPGDLIGIETCVTEYNYVNGVLITTGPAIGINVISHKPFVKPTSGYHVHEGTVGNPSRPEGGWLQAPANGDVVNTTGTDGCVTPKFLTATYSGLIVFTSTVQPNGATTGVQDDLTVDSVNRGNLEPYPDNVTINQPQGLYHDPGHTDLTRYFTDPVVQQLTFASQNYLTTLQNTPGAIIDRLDIYRGSLPWGGIADNNVYGADIWTVPLFEEHEWGVEADIRNPETKQQGLLAYAQLSLVRAGCALGKFRPTYGTLLDDAYAFWLTQDPVHVTCIHVGNAGSTSGHGPIPIGHGR